MTSFQSLELPEFLLRSVRRLGYQRPTPIQVQAIPLVATGRDVAAEAQTGSGKTAAFALPILERLVASPSRGSSVPVLVLVPTRELALQVAAAFKGFARFAPEPVRVLAVIGGEPIQDQITALRSSVRVVVATPGRLLDLVAGGEIDLSRVRTLVLDEADKLLELGFAHELDRLFEALPQDRQTLFFSATLPPRVLAFGERVLHDPITVHVDELPIPVQGIEQRVFQVDRDKRRLLLQHLIRAESWGQTVVFVATRRATENLAAKLRGAGISAAALHGRLEQLERTQVLGAFKRGEVSVLIATDIASRGIDFQSLAVVVNFDLPRAPRDYVHRIGRTGRAGQSGLAISFVDHETAAHLSLIEKRCQVQLEREQVPGFELTTEAPQRERGPAPVKGKRRSKKDKLRAAAERDSAAFESGTD